VIGYGRITELALDGAVATLARVIAETA